VPPLRLQNPAISRGTREIIHRLLHKDPKDRFGSASDVRQALLALPEPGSEPEEPEPSAKAIPVSEPPVVTDNIPQPTWQSSAEPEVELNLPVGQGSQQASVPRLAIALGSVLAISMLAAIVLWLFTLNPATVSTASAPMVPDLRGQSEAVAVSTIDSLGLSPSVIEEVSGEFDEGLVIRTEPGPGLRVAQGERVRVFVSAGADQIQLPDVINQPVEEARAQLTELGLGLTEDRLDYSPNIPEGTVLRMSPEPGTQLNPGDPVSLTVSNGLVLVPDVRGITVGEANPLLSGPDIQLTVRLQPDTSCQGQVVQSQSLAPGEHPQRSEITLTYCAGFDPANPFAPEVGDG